MDRWRQFIHEKELQEFSLLGVGVRFPRCSKNYKVISSWGGFARSEQVYKDNNVINLEESAGIDKELQIIFEKTSMNLLMSNY